MAPQTNGTPHTGHIGLNVSDLQRSLRFYQEAFGFRVTHLSNQEGRLFALLGDGQSLVLTLWQQSAGRFQKQHPGLHHLSFQVANLEELQRAEQKLRQLGASFLYDGIVPHAEGAQSGGIFFEDPDGIRLEIYAPEGVTGSAAPVKGGPSCGLF